MKVLRDRSDRAISFWRASVVALASALVALVGLIPTPASAISRTDVLTRAQTWVKKRVRYSQRSYFAGYRRDCSGFVSMAWRTGRSYTSSTLRRVAKHIPLSKLKPGDAVHTPGHVAIFVRWKSKARGLYVAMEESSWGKPALRRVRKLGHNATGLRYHRITEPVLVADIGTGDASAATASIASTASVASLPATPGILPSSSVFPTISSLLPTGSLESTLSALSTDLFAVFELPSLQPTTTGTPAGTTTRIAVVPLY